MAEESSKPTNKPFGRQLEQKQKLPIREIHESDILPGTIKQRHIGQGAKIVFFGDASDRPSDGSTQIKVFFARDESKLYIWNSTNDAWESVTLS